MRYKLGEVAKIRYGKDHKKLDDGNIPVYGSGGIMRYVDTALYDKKSVLIPRKGSLGNLFFANKPFWTVDTLFYTEIDENILMPEFLFYKLKMFNLASMNVGSAVPSLTTAILNALELGIPSLEVQSQIVNILKAFDERISLNKQINHQFSNICATITAILSAVLIFLDIPNKWRLTSGVVYVAFLCVIYIFLWRRANRLRQVNIKIGVTTLIVKSGDIFEEDGLKAIAFNEYFDTTVDDKIIAKKSLNGQFILNHIDDVAKLNSDIESDDDLKNSIVEKEVKRKQGKMNQYKLGSSILINDEYILTAFSRFNKNNQAELTIQEYVNFLLTFWNEINRLYAQRSVTVPVFGSGITRFKNGFEDIDINELLRIMIWTFKVSKIKFAYPAKLTIIVHNDLLNQVNLYKLKENE